MNKKKKIKVIKIILIVIIIMIVSSGAVYYKYLSINKAKVVKIEKDDESLGIDTDLNRDADNQKIIKNEAEEENKIINIAVFGNDRRNKNENGRSDTIMILSIDNNNKVIKISSIMRDTYVSVENHGMTKITHAYSYGGAQLAIKTINQNFNLDIRDYVKVDFDGFKNIIDKLGGINITVKEYEVEEMKEVGINSAGTYNLNGEQALEYSRIRYSGLGDYERTERQRTVLIKIINKVKDNGIKNYPNIVSDLSSYVETSISKNEMLKMGLNMFTSGINRISQQRFPKNENSNGVMIDGIYYLKTDINETSEEIKKFIYEN